MRRSDAAAQWAAEIFAQLSADDVAGYRPEAWREGLSLLTWDAQQGPRPATEDVLRELTRDVEARR